MMDIRNCDCMELLKSLPDKSVDLVVTDPPYLFDSCSGGGCFGIKHKTHLMEIARINGGIPTEVLEELIRVQKRINMYVWGNWKLISKLVVYFAGKDVSTNILSWHKTNPVPMCSNRYLSDTEYCLFVRGKGVKVGGSYADSKTYWLTPVNKGDKDRWNHPTIKPEPIIEQLIKNSSGGGDTVLDPYLGSGTTAVCCKKLGRHFIGSEINPEYCKTAINRVGGILDGYSTD